MDASQLMEEVASGGENAALSLGRRHQFKMGEKMERGNTDGEGKITMGAKRLKVEWGGMPEDVRRYAEGKNHIGRGATGGTCHGVSQQGGEYRGGGRES